MSETEKLKAVAPAPSPSLAGATAALSGSGVYTISRDFHARQALPQDVVDRMCLAHAAFIENKGGGKRADFSYKDLSRLDLSHRNLDGADFTGAVLSEATAENSSFVDATFFCANLANASLVGSVFRRANLRGSIFRGADLTRADLTQSDMRDGAIATKSAFGDLRKVEVDKSQPGSPKAQSKGEAIAPGDLRDVKFVMARLDGARMNGVVAQNADFSDAVMRGAVLDRVNLKNAKLDGADLEGASLVSVKIDGATFRNANLRKAAIDPVDGIDTKERLAQASRPALTPDRAAIAAMIRDHALWFSSGGKEGARFSIENADLCEGDFGEKAFLPAIIARGCYFGGAVLVEAMLAAADLEGSDFRSADLSRADLRGAKLRGVNFAHTRLDGAKLDGLDLVSGNRLETVVRDIHVAGKTP